MRTFLLVFVAGMVPLAARDLGRLVSRRRGGAEPALAVLSRVLDTRPRPTDLILVCPRCGWSAAFAAPAGAELVVVANGVITVGRTVVHRCRQAA